MYNEKSEGHLTSTLMDVWWLWLNPPHGNMGFQRVIHRLTFLLTSKQPAGYFKSGSYDKNSAGDSLVFGSAVFSSSLPVVVFVPKELVWLFCMSLNSSSVLRSFKHTAPLRAQLSRRQSKVIRDKSHGL